MTAQYIVDNDDEVYGFDTLEAANKKATEWKKEKPLQTIYISKLVNGANGEVHEVIGEA